MYPTGLYPNGFYQTFQQRTSILLKTRCYLHTASWNEKWPSKRRTSYTSLTLGCTPHWSKISWWYTTRATTSKSNWTAYWIGTRPCTAMPTWHTLKVSLHTILIGVMGTIYTCHTELTFSKLGLDRCRVRKLTLDLITHSIQYATKIINTSRRLKNIKERTYGSFQNPPDPH